MATIFAAILDFTQKRPFPSCLVPLFQSKSWCKAIHMKMSSHADKTDVHMKGFVRGLALKKRQHNSEMAY